jgi:hypothetical protein
MDALAEKLDTRLREWESEAAAQSTARISEVLRHRCGGCLPWLGIRDSIESRCRDESRRAQEGTRHISAVLAARAAARGGGR